MAVTVRSKGTYIAAQKVQAIQLDAPVPNIPPVMDTEDFGMAL